MVKAVRGAISVKGNDHSSMEEAASSLIKTIEDKNGIDEKRIISLVFSQTKDLNVANPAAALRKSGDYAQIPLFCTQEPEYEGSLPHMLRVLVTYETKEECKPNPVYLGEAVKLRKDLHNKDEK